MTFLASSFFVETKLDSCSNKITKCWRYSFSPHAVYVLTSQGAAVQQLLPVRLQPPFPSHLFLVYRVVRNTMSTPVDLVPCVPNAHNTKKEELEEEWAGGGVGWKLASKRDA